MRSKALRCALLLAAIALVYSALAWAGTVTICHVPPGNPDNAHTITVDDDAVAAHLGHGDHLGSCGDLCTGVVCPPPTECQVSVTCSEGACVAVNKPDGTACTIIPPFGNALCFNGVCNQAY